MKGTRKIPSNYFQQVDFAEVERIAVAREVSEINKELKEAGLKSGFSQQIHDEHIFAIVDGERDLLIKVLAKHSYLMEFIKKVDKTMSDDDIDDDDKPISDEIVNDIVAIVGKSFRTFGGGRGSDTNPIADALKNQKLQFAAGVDVEAVVRAVIGELYE